MRGKSMMWRLRKDSEGDSIVLRLSGRITSEQLDEVKRHLAKEHDANNLVLDLEEMKLVGQEAVTFLAACQARGTKLRNCPAYIKEWIAREGGK
jgi:anti-anti-sigma regulatory factor